MVFDYFSFARAKKNQEALEKTNPQNPVLKQEDEYFLERVATKEGPDAPLPPSVIADDGTEKPADLKASQEAAGSVALPETTKDEDETLKESEIGSTTSPGTTKRTWGSYVPSVPSLPSIPVWRSSASTKTSPPSTTDPKGIAALDPHAESPIDTAPAEVNEKVDEKVDEKIDERVSERPDEKADDKSGESTDRKKDESSDEKAETSGSSPYPPGVKVTENVKLDEEKQEADRREMSVLLDRLSFSSINNRVFSFSKESQKLYENFTIVLKDMMNGAPTAYEDMERLLHDNDSQIRSMFNNMPPFVQTLVKSLPAKFGGTLGPEILAAASEKPGADMKARMRAASQPQKGKKKNVPSVQGIANEKGAVAGMLRSTVTFLKTRFPTFVTGTNVIMSLAVFILMFVFWYCHKRGREVRLQKEAGAASSNEEEESEVDSSLDESQILTPDTTETEDSKDEADLETPSATEESNKSAQDILAQPQPAEVPLPERPDEKELHNTTTN